MIIIIIQTDQLPPCTLQEPIVRRQAAPPRGSMKRPGAAPKSSAKKKKGQPEPEMDGQETEPEEPPPKKVIRKAKDSASKPKAKAKVKAKAKAKTTAKGKAKSTAKAKASTTKKKIDTKTAKPEEPDAVDVEDYIPEGQAAKRPAAKSLGLSFMRMFFVMPSQLKFRRS